MRIKRPRLLAMSTVAIVLAAVFSTNASGGQSPDGPVPPAPLVITASPDGVREMDLRVMTFNVAGLPGPLRKTRSDALQLIGDEFAKMRAMGTAPHVLVLQEAFTDEARAIGKRAGYAYERFGPDENSAPLFKSAQKMPELLATRYARNGEGLGKIVGSGLAIFSDLPISDAQMTAFGADDCAGTDCFANKGVMLVNIAIPGLAGGIDIANTHMNSLKAAGKPYSRSLMAYQRQSDVLRAFIDSKAKTSVPMIFAGDFNASETRDRFQYLERTLGPEQEVFEICAQLKGCALDIGKVMGGFWQASLDLHWIRPSAGVDMAPVNVAWAFQKPVQGTMLSDHKALTVTYHLRWQANERVALN